MATTVFKTRRLPQSSTQASNNNGMPEHLDAANPHPQYLLVSDYVGGAGNIDLSAYLTKVKYNEDQNAYNTWKSSIDTWKSNIDTWKTTYGGYVDTLRSWKSTTADPAISQISQLATNLGNHLVKYSQNAAANSILSHMDTEGKELYARRIHTHTLTDLNAATADHNHDDNYLKLTDVYTSRTTPNGDTVTALSDIFSDINHGHNQFVYTSDLEEAGIYPSAKNPFINYDATIASIDFNEMLDQGIYNIHPQSDQTVSNAPTASVNGFLIVIEDETVIGENSGITITTAGVHVAHQWHMGDNGAIRKRTVTSTDAVAYAWVSSSDEELRIYTKTATGAAGLDVYSSSNMGVKAGTTTTGDTSSITYNGTVYNRDSARDTIGSSIVFGSWRTVNAPTRIKGVVNSGTAYTMDCLDTDIQKITLNNNCVLTVNNVDAGRTVYLYVTANGTYSLTYNNVTLISNEDTGLYRIEFQSDGTAVRCVNVMAILA